LKTKIIVLICLMLSILGAEQYSRFLNLGIIYPITMNRSKDQAVNINISLLQNSVGDVKGVNMCGFSSICNGDVHGLQSSFFYSQINGDHLGASFSTLNFTNNNFYGAQLGLAANMTGRSVKGAQSGGIINFVGGNFDGYQQSGVYNITGKTFKGVQFAGIGNAVGENFFGLQSGVIFNFTAKRMQGMQWSGVNIAGELHGLQVGYINLSQVNHGCQIGLLNIAEEQNGFPIGLINLSDEGNIQWLNYSSSFCEFITGIRFVSGRAVSSLEFGGAVIDSQYDHYGYRIPWKKFGFDADLGYFHIASQNNDEEEFHHELAIEFRLGVHYQINNWLGITAGMGTNIKAPYEEETVAEESDLFYAGITLF